MRFNRILINAVAWAVVWVQVGCASASKQLDQLPSDDEVKSFIESCERTVVAGDWRALRSCFLPTARILFLKSGSPRWQEMPVDAWIQALKYKSKVLGYRRTRKIVAIESRPSDGQVIVRSEFREEFLQAGGRRIFEMEEAVAIVGARDAPLIASIAYRVDRETLEPISKVQ